MSKQSDRQAEATREITKWVNKYRDLDKDYLLQQTVTVVAIIIAMNIPEDEEIAEDLEVVSDFLPKRVQHYIDLAEEVARRHGGLEEH